MITLIIILAILFILLILFSCLNVAHAEPSDLQQNKKLVEVSTNHFSEGHPKIHVKVRKVEQKYINNKYIKIKKRKQIKKFIKQKFKCKGV